MPVVVTRSPLRLLAHVLLGIPAVLLAVDMAVSHRFYPAPDSVDVVVGTTIDESGRTVEVTSRRLTEGGRSQARRDRLFAVVLLGGGSISIAWAMRELIRPRLLLRGDHSGLAVRVDGIGRPMLALSWDEIAEVRSGMVEVDGELLPALSLRFHDPEAVPVAPSSALAEPPWLHVVADDWYPAAHLVAPVLERVSPRPAGAPDDG